MPLHPHLYLQMATGWRLAAANFVCSHQQQHLHLQSLVTTLDTARKVEVATREQSNTMEWHCVRMPRITEIRDQSSGENLAQRIRKGVAQTVATKRVLAREPVAIQVYWPCGFVIHPDAPLVRVIS